LIAEQTFANQGIPNNVLNIRTLPLVEPIILALTLHPFLRGCGRVALHIPESIP
jgi:hypothetical protein